MICSLLEKLLQKWIPSRTPRRVSCCCCCCCCCCTVLTVVLSNILFSYHNTGEEEEKTSSNTKAPGSNRKTDREEEENVDESTGNNFNKKRKRHSRNSSTTSIKSSRSKTNQIVQLNKTVLKLQGKIEQYEERIQKDTTEFNEACFSQERLRKDRNREKKARVEAEAVVVKAEAALVRAEEELRKCGRGVPSGDVNKGIASWLMAAIRNNVCKDLKFAEDPETVYHAILTAVLRHMPGFDTRIVDNKNNFKAEEFVVTYYRSAKQAINQYRQYSQKR